jgi:hypothetical protein
MHAAAFGQSVAEAAVGALDAMLVEVQLQLALLGVGVVELAPLGVLLAGYLLVGF